MFENQLDGTVEVGGIWYVADCVALGFENLTHGGFYIHKLTFCGIGLTPLCKINVFLAIGQTDSVGVAAAFSFRNGAGILPMLRRARARLQLPGRTMPSLFRPRISHLL